MEVITITNNENAVHQVIDRGNGISKEEQKHIFSRFYRIDKARGRDTGGTGLGLAIAQTIARAHQGDLTVMSKQGEGSHFILKLPLFINGEKGSHRILISFTWNIHLATLSFTI